MRTNVIARTGAAVAVAVAGYVHLRIWQNDYRHAPVREMFVANWVLSAFLAVALLGSIGLRMSSRAHRPVLLAGMAFSLATLVAFALSRGPGLPTVHGTFKEHGIETTASYFFGLGSAKVILVAETVAAVLCGWQLIATTKSADALRPDQPARSASRSAMTTPANPAVSVTS